MGRLNWVLVLFIVSFSLLLVVPEPVTANECTPSVNQNCIDIYCKVQSSNNSDIRVPIFNGTHYIKSQQILNQSQLGMPIQNSQDLQALSAICVMPEFNTKYCTSRGIWNTRVTVNRTYLDSQGATKHQGFILHSVSAFNCLDWIPPQIREITTKSLFEIGGRIVNFKVSDNETALLVGTDNSNLSACAYRSYPRGTTLPTTRLDLASLPSGWTREPTCTNLIQTTELITINQANASNDFVIYAIDTDNNFVYHRINGTPMYPSLPLNNPQGFCPRQNECYIPGGTQLQHNSFEAVYNGTGTPICVKPGETINDVYCDASRGLMTKSERLYEVARQQSKTYPNANITIYCSDISRMQTLQDRSNTPTLCSFSTQSSQGNCMNACTMYVESAAGRNAFFYSSVNKPSELRVPGIIPNLITNSSCEITRTPYSYLTCPYNFRGSQALSVYYYGNQSLLHVGTQASGTVKNLSLDVTNQLQNELMMINLRGNISRYYREIRLINNGYINPVSFDGKVGAYQNVAYRRNGNRTILGIRVNPNENRLEGESDIGINPVVIGVIYHSYNGDQIRDYVNSVQSPAYPLRQIQVYRHGDYTVVVGSVQDDNRASIVLEQLVIRIRPGGLS